MRLTRCIEQLCSESFMVTRGRPTQATFLVQHWFIHVDLIRALWQHFAFGRNHSWCVQSSSLSVGGMCWLRCPFGETYTPDSLRFSVKSNALSSGQSSRQFCASVLRSFIRITSSPNPQYWISSRSFLSACYQLKVRLRLKCLDVISWCFFVAFLVCFLASSEFVIFVLVVHFHFPSPSFLNNSARCAQKQKLNIISILWFCKFGL